MSIIPNYKKENEGLKANIKSMVPVELLKVFNDEAEKLGLELANPLKLTIGEKVPLFELPNAVSKTIALQELLVQGPVVIFFYRGNWCPYCNLQLGLYQRILPNIKSFGANLIAISPQNPDSSLSNKEKNALEFEVLSDKGNEVARKFTTIIKNSEEAIESAAKLGIDFYEVYDDKSREIPVPAVFIIDKNGEVVFAKAESGDYRERVEPKEILDVLEKIKE
jgi:peroxiredoxin